MFTISRLPIPSLLFSLDDPNCSATDKLKGLHRFGPYKPLKRTPTFAFVFPKGRNQDANSLFLALRNGIGPFKGFPTVFRTRLDKSQVQAITGFTVPTGASHRAAGQAYVEAISKWLENRTKPDLIFILHERTPDWEEDTPYQYCKHALLREGVVSQSVTFDLLKNSSQFEWSAANIALAVFCKLGGVPWVAAHTARQDHVILGVGRAEVQDPMARTRRRRTAFTTCLTGKGEFKFSTVGRTVETREDYLAELTKAVETSINRATAVEATPTGIAIHVTKNFSREEMSAVQRALPTDGQMELSVLKVTEEPHFFVVEAANPSGIPERGTCVRLSSRDALLYTEGRDDPRSWRDRLPAAIRVQDHSGGPQLAREALRELLDLSQVNFRGFNARSSPAPLVYSYRVAKLIESGGDSNTDTPVHADLAETMWFL